MNKISFKNVIPASIGAGLFISGIGSFLQKIIYLSGNFNHFETNLASLIVKLFLTILVMVIGCILLSANPAKTWTKEEE